MLIDRIRTVPPVGYALDVPNDLREHCRATPDDDGELFRLLNAAADLFEAESGLALMRQTWELHLSAIPSALELKPSPIISVDSVAYYDPDEQLQLIDAGDYIASPQIRLLEIPKSRPSLSSRSAPVIVTLTSGFGSGPDDIPDRIKQAVRLYVGHLFANREATAERQIRSVELAYKHLLGSAIVDWI